MPIPSFHHRIEIYTTNTRDISRLNKQWNLLARKFFFSPLLSLYTLVFEFMCVVCMNAYAHVNMCVCVCRVEISVSLLYHAPRFLIFWDNFCHWIWLHRYWKSVHVSQCIPTPGFLYGFWGTQLSIIVTNTLLTEPSLQLLCPSCYLELVSTYSALKK